MDNFLTIQQAAELMKVHRITVWRLVRSGRLRSFQLDTNRRVKLVRRADIEALMTPRPIEDITKKATA